MLTAELLEEGQHLMTVCNACRYCEGFCAVWQAMETRTVFEEKDLNYLSNLCHNCSECYYSCQYSPPHLFNINPPETLAKLRVYSYELYAWPRAVRESFPQERSSGLATHGRHPHGIHGCCQRDDGRSPLSARPRWKLL